MKVELGAIWAPDRLENELEDEIADFFAEVVYEPLMRVFYEERMNSLQNGEPDSSYESWDEFPAWADSLGYDRAKMPQIASEDRDALVSYLRGRGIASREADVLPGTLKPTQRLFSHEKLSRARQYQDKDRPLLCSSDNRILDGHHQWFKSLLDEPFKSVRAIIFDSRIPRLVREANWFPSVERANAARPAPDPAEIVAALNSGKISYADGVFSGKFSASISRGLKHLGAKYEASSKTFRLPARDLPYNLRGAIAASKARAETINETLVKRSAEIAANVAASPTLGLKLDKWTRDLIEDLEDQFIATLTKIPKTIKAEAFVATPPDFSPAMVADVRATLTENITLSIKTFTETEMVKVRELAELNWMNGGRVDLLREMLEERFAISKRKARFLARQETSMVASEFARARAQEIGSTEYVWHTRHDDRVRHDHQELNGTTQKWDDPPIVDKAKDRRANPGMDFGCRCVARPILNLAARRVA